jgi:Isocitrate/isopropylmalate dehydrogenase
MAVLEKASILTTVRIGAVGTAQRDEEAMGGTLYILAGDGIGPEVMREVTRLIGWMNKRRTCIPRSGKVWLATPLNANGVPLTDETAADVSTADAVLFGRSAACAGTRLQKRRRHVCIRAHLLKALGVEIVEDHATHNDGVQLMRSGVIDGAAVPLTTDGACSFCGEDIEPLSFGSLQNPSQFRTMRFLRPPIDAVPKCLPTPLAAVSWRYWLPHYITGLRGAPSGCSVPARRAGPRGLSRRTPDRAAVGRPPARRHGRWNLPRRAQR